MWLDLASLTAGIGRLPSSDECPVSVVGGCSSYVDGPTPSADCPLEPGLVTAVSLHPTRVAGVMEDGVRALVDQCTEMRWAYRGGRLGLLPG